MDVFICHSGKDIEVTESICALLSANEITYWLAEEKELCGKSYMDQILAAMDQSTMVLLLGSQSAMTSDDVMGEISHAKDNKIPMIPVLLGNLKKSEMDRFKYIVGMTHYLTYAPTDEFSCALLMAINAHRKPSHFTPALIALKKYVSRPFSWWPVATVALAVVLLLALLFGKNPAQQPIDDDSAATTTTITAAATSTATPESTTTTMATEAPTTMSTAAPTTTNTNPVDKTYNQVPDLYRQELDNFIASDSKVGHTDIVKVGNSTTPHLAKVWTYIASYSSDTRIATAEGNVITGVSPGVAYVVLISSMGKTDIYKITVID